MAGMSAGVAGRIVGVAVIRFKLIAPAYGHWECIYLINPLAVL